MSLWSHSRGGLWGEWKYRSRTTAEGGVGEDATARSNSGSQSELSKMFFLFKKKKKEKNKTSTFKVISGHLCNRSQNTSRAGARVSRGKEAGDPKGVRGPSGGCSRPCHPHPDPPGRREPASGHRCTQRRLLLPAPGRDQEATGTRSQTLRAAAPETRLAAPPTRPRPRPGSPQRRARTAERSERSPQAPGPGCSGRPGTFRTFLGPAPRTCGGPG